MSRPVWTCFACGMEHFKVSPNYCDNCSAPLRINEYQEWVKAGNVPKPNGWKKTESTSQTAPATAPAPAPALNKEEETKMETKTYNRGLIWVVVIIIALAIGYILIKNQNDQIAWEKLTVAQQRDELTNRMNVLESSKTAVVATPPASDYVSATNDEHFITVFRGATDQETINFNNAWPTYKPNDTIDWSDNSFHMDGGTWIIQYDGIISGDVDVNHIEGEPHTYDNDEHTFQVVQVKKGDRVDVTSPWMAWYTSHYSKELIVASVQTQFPTWTRQNSKLN